MKFLYQFQASKYRIHRCDINQPRIVVFQDRNIKSCRREMSMSSHDYNGELKVSFTM